MLSITNRNLFAQTDSIIIEHISTQEGLSNRHVRCVMVDSYGFLWIGTDDGLNRYDGYEFIIYKNNIWDTTSLSSPVISLLTEDEDGNIWVSTSNGLNFYQRHSDSFIRYTHDPENEYSIIDNDDINAIVVDRIKSNYVWIGTGGGGLNLFDTELQRFYSIKYDSSNVNSLSGNNISSLFQDSFGYLWIGTSGTGLNRIDLHSIPTTKDGKYDVNKFNLIVFEHYLNYGNDGEDIHSASVRCILEDREGITWVLLSDSVEPIFLKEKNKFISSPYFNSLFREHKGLDFHEMLEDNRGMKWFGAHNRVFLFDPKNKQIKEHTLNKLVTRSSSNQGLCVDNAGNIWAASWDGLVRIYRDTPLFEHYYHNVDDPSLPASVNTYSFLADRLGKVWIATAKGLLLMEKDIDGSIKFINYSELYNFNEGFVVSIIEDNRGSIWAVLEYTLIRIDPSTNSIFQYENTPEKHNALTFQKKQKKLSRVKLLLDDADNLWVSAWGGGISKVSLEELYSTNNLQDVEFTNYFNDPDDLGSLVLNFIQDSSGYFWICTPTGGVIRFDPQTENFKAYQQESNNLNSLSINYTISVREDVKGNIWVGTYGGGLNRFNKETESFTHYSSKDGLPSDIIQGILEDDNGNLWISTNRGITKFNPENNKFRNYDRQENEVSFHDTRTGKMYFGNDNGFIVFHPDSVKESKYVPPVVLTKFTRYSDENDGEQIIDRTISAKNNIELTYKDDIISFEFAAISFDTNIKYVYAYQLEGFNNNWISLGMKRDVTFTNLDPGDYNFKVKACNQDGIWCDNFTSIQIYISPPWWSNRWAYGTYVLFFLGLLYGIRRFELNRRKEKEDKRILELENDRKTKELKQASKLQLSMLPKEIPVIPNLDIAAYMKTATEVGGDYYDFCRSEDGNYFTAVLGDATGHGMNAGMMVGISKGLFKNLAQQPDLQYVISQFNSSLLSMELQPMYMSLCFLRIIYNELQLVGAGMPPSLLFQNKLNNIMEIESSGPPLGGFANFDYEICNYKLSSGDIILIMSDGFPERRNSEKEIIGWDKAREILTGMKDCTADEIVKEFVKASDEWGGEIPPDDDFTLLAIKVK